VQKKYHSTSRIRCIPEGCTPPVQKLVDPTTQEYDLFFCLDLIQKMREKSIECVVGMLVTLIHSGLRNLVGASAVSGTNGICWLSVER
jgi:hypothetical protein